MYSHTLESLPHMQAPLGRHNGCGSRSSRSSSAMAGDEDGVFATWGTFDVLKLSAVLWLCCGCEYIAEPRMMRKAWRKVQSHRRY